MKKGLLISCMVAIATHCLSQEIYTIKTKEIKAQVPSTLWGLFFEDINRSADGGLYAEMVKNRSFDFPFALDGWSNWPSPKLRDGIFVIANQNATNADNPKFLSVNLQPTDTVGLLNQGFNSMVFKKNLPYTLTLRYRSSVGRIHARAFLFNPNHFVANTDLGYLDSKQWTEQRFTITPSDSTSEGKLLIIFEGEGKADVDRISLFPTDTWKHKPGGLRDDLVQSLYDLKPGFLRFPGGCIVEGQTLDNRYQWKKTIGPLENRKLNFSNWNDAVPARPLPDYFQSYGLGFLEYFELCEDIGAEPMPILNCGLSCQFGVGETAPLNQMDTYVQDALDLIEFANGDEHTIWGERRIQYGHPRPFNMKMLGIGNENWGPQYVERLDIFTKAIKAKYPDIKLICATGYSPNPPFHYMDSVLRKQNVDIIDEHYYETANWFFHHAGKYDHYDRKGPKIFLGEYACHSVGIGSLENKNTLMCALAEAAFMTGLERNSDIVTMASYAPLFGHVKDWQWTPNLIWFDERSSYMTPSYYVQQLFSVNKGTGVVPLLINGNPVTGQDSCWASAVIDKNTGELIIKIINASPSLKQKKIAVDVKLSVTATVTSLSSPDPTVVNSLTTTKVKPVSKTMNINGKEMVIAAEPYSLTVIRVKIKS